METKKMTIAEAQQLVRNTKYIVWNEDESRKLQDKFFEIGCRWLHSGKTICHTNHPFLMVDEYLNIHYRDVDNYEYFEKEKNLLTEAYYIHIIELEQEPKPQPKPKFDPKILQPFDKVLMRQDKITIWQARIFEARVLDDKYSATSGGVFNYCIPYNDETKHLLRTNDEAPEFYQLD